MNILFRAVAAAVLSVVGLGGAHADTVPPFTAGYSVSIRAFHVRVQLSVPRLTYPRNALVKVSVTRENLSSHLLSEPMALLPYNCAPAIANAEVRDLSGQLLWPLPGPYSGDCAAPRASLLKSHSVQKETQIVVLRGPVVRGITEINVRRSLSIWGYRAALPDLVLHLRNEPAPRATIGTDKRGTYADLTRPQGATGRLWYEEWSSCSTRSPHWISTTGTRIQLHCTPKRGTWHLVAGWLNHPAFLLNPPAAERVR